MGASNRVKILTEDDVIDIVRQAHPELPFPRDRIDGIVSSINHALRSYEFSISEQAEPTVKQLRSRIDKLYKAATTLKSALPTLTEISLYHYLAYVGEQYASAHGGHPNLAPHEVSGLIYDENENSHEVSAVDHYRTGERLDEIINGITELLAWMENSPPDSQLNKHNWVDEAPPWEWGENGIADRLEQQRRSPDEHREIRCGVHLIGTLLPRVYQLTFFGRKYGVGRTVKADVTTGYGPGIRFVAGICKAAGIEVSPETIIKYRQRAISPPSPLAPKPGSLGTVDNPT